MEVIEWSQFQTIGRSRRINCSIADACLVLLRMRESYVTIFFSVAVMLKVCVIGAGAAGLCAARHLLTRPDLFRAAVFEAGDALGGTWIYTPNASDDVHSSMYRDLKTNLPKEVMAFPDFPFPTDGGPSFLRHEAVLDYLQRYAKAFGVAEVIRFNTRVERIRPVGATQWLVTTRQVDEDSSVEEEFDAVLVCNGHVSKPNYGAIANSERYCGQVMHSHYYRQPDAFRGLVVAVLGASSSGVDIGLEIACVARLVYLSHNGAALKNLPSNVVQTAGIVACEGERGFLLADGSKLQADCLVHCTGYKYDYSFLSPECGVSVVGRRVGPLFKHLVNISRPSMAVVGVPMAVAPFPLYDRQVQFFLKMLACEIAVPSSEAMLAEVRNEEKKRRATGDADRHFHKFGGRQWAYNDELASLGGFAPLPPKVQWLYEAVHRRRQEDVTNYKDDVIVNNGDQYELQTANGLS